MVVDHVNVCSCARACMITASQVSVGVFSRHCKLCY